MRQILIKSLLILLVSFLSNLSFANASNSKLHLQKITRTYCLNDKRIYTSNANFPLDSTIIISGMSVSGSVTLNDKSDSYVVITMTDSYNAEHLVYETYQMLADTSSITLNNVAYESAFLDNVKPKQINLYIHNAKLCIDSIHYNDKERVSQYGMKVSRFIKEQSEEIVETLNRNLEKQNALWRAGITSMSEKTYEEKKAMFGGKVPQLYGFDYYTGGIFIMPNESNMEIQESKTESSGLYVNEWDWRNRHGKNWMTSVKNQGICGSCGAFSALGALEAYINLYYNRILDYDLSEEELISCISSFDCDSSGMNQGTALTYVQNNGIVTESCFNYVGYEKDCNQKCQNPSEVIYVDEHDTIFYTAGEDYIKSRLFNAPLPFGIKSWKHALVLVGYKTIQVGDAIQTGPHTSITINATDHSNLIGKTAWLLKNSWGTNWGNQGYAYVYTYLTNLKWMYAIGGNITSMTYSNSDIVCSDADGDGLYFWGISPNKPAHCPSWVPDTPDGDDSNINYGALDNYGNLAALPAGVTIKTPVTYSSNSSTSYRLGIVNGGTLTITGTTTLTGESKIRVCEGGKLIIDGGTLQNADITLVPGSSLIVRNNGVINMATGKSLEAPKGALVNIESGEIH